MARAWPRRPGGKQPPPHPHLPFPPQPKTQEAVEALGPAGPAAVVATVAAAEMVPLLPTTPLALVAGLLLGAGPGAACVLAGNLAAATGAFFVSRGVGARFARAVVAAEGGGGGGGSGPDGAAKPCPLSAAAPGGLWARVSAAVDAGSPAEKVAAVAALRATPVIPFSLSSYALGLAPRAGLSYPVYIAGTAVGASVWAGVYASLGAASRTALAAACGGTGTGHPEGVLVDLIDRAAAATEGAACVAAGVAGAALLAWGAATAVRRGRGGGGGKSAAPTPPSE